MGKWQKLASSLYSNLHEVNYLSNHVQSNIYWIDHPLETPKLWSLNTWGAGGMEGLLNLNMCLTINTSLLLACIYWLSMTHTIIYNRDMSFNWRTESCVISLYGQKTKINLLSYNLVEHVHTAALEMSKALLPNCVMICKMEMWYLSFLLQKLC